jgi:GDPmannose 4,6-dehydratase
MLTTAYGQDAIYLGRLLKKEGIEVLVLNHKSSVPQNFGHFDYVSNLSFIQTSDLLDKIKDYNPQEIYNLAAISSVAASWQNPSLAMEVNGFAVERLVNGLSKDKGTSHIKFFQAGSTDMVGKEIIGSEESDFSPWSPYGESKEYARRAVRFSRDQFGLWAVNGILTNHDSNYRKKTFVIPLIASQIVAITRGQIKTVNLENPLISRDWAHARDVMNGVRKMMQLSNPIDLTLATGLSMSLAELIEEASKVLNIDLPIQIIENQQSRAVDFTKISVNALPAQQSLNWNPKFTGVDTLIDLVISPSRSSG